MHNRLLCSMEVDAVIYKFKSKASGDLIMMGPNGDALLRVLGREPEAKGIIEPQQMAQALAALEQAVADEEAARAQAGSTDETAADKLAGAGADRVNLRQRLWPMHDMLKRALAANEPVVWGV